jgi:hypothetical protein
MDHRYSNPANPSLFGYFLPTVHTQNIIKGSIVGKADYYRYYNHFPTSPNSSKNSVVGKFSGSGESGNDMSVLIMTQNEHANYAEGKPARYYYNSGKIRMSGFVVNLPSGYKDYVIVFDNTFSTETDKEISATLEVKSTY